MNIITKEIKLDKPLICSDGSIALWHYVSNMVEELKTQNYDIDTHLHDDRITITGEDYAVNDIIEQTNN